MRDDTLSAECDQREAELVLLLWSVGILVVPMKAHGPNALRLARVGFPPSVQAVIYPGLKRYPRQALVGRHVHQEKEDG